MNKLIDMYNKSLYVPKYLQNNASKPKVSKDCYVSPLLKGTSRKGLNPYYSFNNENYDTSGEIDMIQDLLDEHIRIHGYMCTYIIRTDHTLDQVYGESLGATYENSFRIEMMPADPSGMQGRDSIQQYGYWMSDTVELHFSFRRLNDEIAKLGVADRKFPQAGDLISWDGIDVGNLMTVTYVEDKVIPFQKGTWTLYNLICQVYNAGLDTFDTGNSEIDDHMNKYNENYEYPQSDNEDIYNEARKEYVIQEPNNWNLDFSQMYDYNQARKKK